ERSGLPRPFSSGPRIQERASRVLANSRAMRPRERDMRMTKRLLPLAVSLLVIGFSARAEENYQSWTVLRSTFPSTGGNGIIIKGYDPVIAGGKCVTTFMAVTPDGQVYPNYIEFEAVAAQGGTLCQNGKWRAMDGGASGTTPFRVFFK